MDNGEFIGQESLATASEMAALAQETGVDSGGIVLDLCCGLGGPALHLAKRLGWRVVGVDRSHVAVQAAQLSAAERGQAGRVRFLVADAMELPLAGPFDAALLFETALAIRDKGKLLREVSRVLRPGGCFALTLEEGAPLSVRERRSIPEGSEIWLATEAEFLEMAVESAFQVCQLEDHTLRHADTAGRLLAAYQRDQEAIAACIGIAAYHRLVEAHLRWVEWLAKGRVRKLALVLQRVASQRPETRDEGM